MKSNRGFTLIELLVVIAIIGILSSVVMASLGSARKKGNDAKLKSQLSNMRSASELTMNPVNGYYGTVGTGNSTGCGNPPMANTVFADVNSGMAALSNSSNHPSPVWCFSAVPPTSWAAVGRYSSDPNGYFCVDSTGTARDKTAAGVPYNSPFDSTLSTAAINLTTKSCR